MYLNINIQVRARTHAHAHTTCDNLPREICDNLPQRHVFICNRIIAAIFDIDIVDQPTC